MVLIALVTALYFWLRSRRKWTDSIDRPVDTWNPGPTLPPQHAYYNHPAAMSAMQTGQSFVTDSNHYVQHPSYGPQSRPGVGAGQYYSDGPHVQLMPYVVPEITRPDPDTKTMSRISLESPSSSPRPPSTTRPLSSSALSDTDIQRVAQMVVGMMPPQSLRGGDDASHALPASPPMYHQK